HRNLIKALTIHALLPPIFCVSAGIYFVLRLNIVRHAALEKAVYTIASIPSAYSALCTLYYVEPYRRLFECSSTPSICLQKSA
ncbi:hypothetical protein PFISCL1PPCAC_4327, partial [Pristionchus fissidentatus]